VKNLLLHIGDSQGQSPVPAEFELSQNYPNPFNPSTVFAYQLPSAGRVTLTVFDMLGRVVAVLVDDVKDAGSHSITFDASGRPSGVYFARLTAGGRSQMKKLVLMK